MPSEILVARETGSILFEGERVIVHKGVTRVRSGHPLLKGHEELFEPITCHWDVEDATARPGQKRHAAEHAPAKSSPES